VDRPRPAVVNTHHNGDHTWGNQLFAGAEIIGHRACAAGMTRERPDTMMMLRAGRESSDPMVADLARQLQPWDFTGVTPTPPTTLLDARTQLDLEGVEVQLIPVGPAHTAGDVVVHLPEAGILFAGDVLFRLCTPIGWDGTYDGWIGALDTIIALAPDVVVPGHGPLCGLEGPREMRDYLVHVRDESRHFFERGVPALGGGGAHRPRSLGRVDGAGAYLLPGGACVPRAPRRAVRHALRRRHDVPRHVRAPPAVGPDGGARMSTVRVDADGDVTIVTIDRPEVRNAVDGPTADALAAAFRAFDADAARAVAVLTGAGGYFCAGADLKAVATGRGTASPWTATVRSARRACASGSPSSPPSRGMPSPADSSWPCGATCASRRATPSSASTAAAGVSRWSTSGRSACRASSA